jgi:glucose-6-phosphate-specific signal transduction histidine kinase
LQDKPLQKYLYQISAPSAGFGLRLMQERVQILGGQLKIESYP